MSKIIIHNRANLSDLEALLIVQEVVKTGKCSKSSKGPQYCFFTTFNNDKIKVSSDKIKDKDTYTFYIYK